MDHPDRERFFWYHTIKSLFLRLPVTRYKRVSRGRDGSTDDGGLRGRTKHTTGEQGAINNAILKG
jgi:hypothetical protein